MLFAVEASVAAVAFGPPAAGVSARLMLWPSAMIRAAAVKWLELNLIVCVCDVWLTPLFLDYRLQGRGGLAEICICSPVFQVLLVKGNGQTLSS